MTEEDDNDDLRASEKHNEVLDNILNKRIWRQLIITQSLTDLRVSTDTTNSQNSLNKEVEDRTVSKELTNDQEEVITWTKQASA